MPFSDNDNSDTMDIEQQIFSNNLVAISNLLSKASNITFCSIPSKAADKS